MEKSSGSRMPLSADMICESIIQNIPGNKNIGIFVKNIQFPVQEGVDHVATVIVRDI